MCVSFTWHSLVCVPLEVTIVSMVGCKLHALVYDILPLEEDAGKRCSECGLDSLHARMKPVATLKV